MARNRDKKLWTSEESVDILGLGVSLSLLQSLSISSALAALGTCSAILRNCRANGRNGAIYRHVAYHVVENDVMLKIASIMPALCSLRRTMHYACFNARLIHVCAGLLKYRGACLDRVLGRHHCLLVGTDISTKLPWWNMGAASWCLHRAKSA